MTLTSCFNEVKGNNTEATDVNQLYDLEGKIELERGQIELQPITFSQAEKNKAKEIEALSQIIKTINQRFGTNFLETDRVFLEQIESALDENEALQKAFAVNSLF